MAVPKQQAEPSTTPQPDPSGLLALGRNPTAAALGGKAYIQLPPDPGSLLRHAPGNWEVGDVDGVPYWLPEISVQPKAPGTPGMRTVAAGADPETGWESAVFQGGRKGWVYIDLTKPVPPQFLPPGVQPGALPFREYDCRDPKTGATGVCSIEVWRVPQPSLPEERQRFFFDRPRYNAWRLWLVESGTIAPPLGHVVAAKIERVRSRIDNVNQSLAAEIRELHLAPKLKAIKRHEEAIVPTRKAAA